MWQEFLNASLRDNLALLASVLGGLGGLSFFLSVGWLRKAKHSSQTILALEDENKQFRLDFIRAQTRLDKVDPDIIGPQLQGQSRLPRAEDRAQLAQRYLALQKDTVTAAALNLAGSELFNYSDDPGTAVARAQDHLDLARTLDPHSPEVTRLQGSVDGLTAALNKTPTVWEPEIFHLTDMELQELSKDRMEAGALEEGVFLATLSTQKAQERTGTYSDNHAGALFTLTMNQARCGLWDAADASLQLELDILRKLHGAGSVNALCMETQAGYVLILKGKHKQAVAFFDTHETRIETVIGNRNNAAMVHTLYLRSLAQSKLGNMRQAKKDHDQAVAIFDYIKVAGDPALKYLSYDPRKDGFAG